LFSVSSAVYLNPDKGVVMVLPVRKRYLFRMISPAYPAFNIYTGVVSKTTALGPVCVATSVSRIPRWDAEVIDENNLGRYGPRADIGVDHELLERERAADVVGLYGGLTSIIPRLYDVARFYKKAGAVTIVGGQHFVEETIPEAFASGVDYVVIGEGEITICELLEALEGKRPIDSVKGIAYRDGTGIRFTPAREKLCDFDQLPLPDFSLVRFAHLRIFPVERIRGCGMNCEFCTVKGQPRPASPERLLIQIRRLFETRNARHFFVVDDLFGQQREETLRFCALLRDYQRLIGRRLDLAVQIRLDKAGDHELLTAMREAGINMVAIGFESPIGEELKAMNKHITPDQMVEWTLTYRRFGFLIHGMFIFGYPLIEGVKFSMDGRERVRRFVRFMRQGHIDTIQVLLPVPLPGTAFRERLKSQDRLYPVEDVGWEFYDGNFPLFEPDHPLSAQELQRCQSRIMRGHYRFRSVWVLGACVCLFPTILLFASDIKAGWRGWYRRWRNNLIRFFGWVIIRGWMHAFIQSGFMNKLLAAQKHLREQRGTARSGTKLAAMEDE
jgi:radical SAM superfamily enzyme YgiQ (UPF0313 family)